MTSYKSMFINVFNFILLVYFIPLIYLYIIDNQFISKWEIFISINSILLLIYQIVLMRIRKIKIIDFRFIFIILTHMFLFGQIYLIALNMESLLFYNVIQRYPSTLIFKASIYGLAYTQFIFSGMVCTINPSKLNSDNDTSIKSVSKKAMFFTGSVIILLAIPFRLYVDIISIIHTNDSGIYTGSIGFSGISTDVAILLVPGLIFIIFSKKLSRKKTFWFIAAFLVYSLIIMILTGDRRYSVTGIMAIILAYIANYEKKIPIKKFFFYVFLLLISLNFLAIIRTIRVSQIVGIFEFFDYYGSDIISLNPIFETLNEFGSTVLTIAFPMKHFPSNFSYLRGLSFYGSIPSILPLGPILGDFFTQVAFTTEVLNQIEGYPAGGSLPGDLYANFGLVGLPIAFVFGHILNRIFIVRKNSMHQYDLAIYYSLFFILINLIRATFIEVLRNSIIVFIIPYVIYNIYINRKTTLGGGDHHRRVH